GRFVAGVLGQHVLLPLASLVAGVLVPHARFAGVRNDDDIRPAVAIEVAGKTGKGFGVLLELPRLLTPNDMHFLEVGPFVPDIADEDVHLAVLVEVGDADTLGAELLINDDFLPGDRRTATGVWLASRLRLPAKREEDGCGNNRRQKRKAPSHVRILGVDG